MSSLQEKDATRTVESESVPAPALAAGEAKPVFGTGTLWLWLSVLFAASGCAGLIYEVVWFQMLQLVIGSTAVSIGVLLASYMGGMCLGSLFLPRWISQSIHPLRVWALLELGIGLLGVLSVYATPWLGQLYALLAPAGLAGILLRGVLCATCLLAPTFLMGATLPAISRL